MGAAALTVSVTDADDDPAELVAVTEYIVEESIPVGVPEITQVVLCRLKPAGSEGAIVQLVMVAPFVLSVVGVTDIGTPGVPEVPVALE